MRKGPPGIQTMPGWGDGEVRVEGDAGPGVEGDGVTDAGAVAPRAVRADAGEVGDADAVLDGEADEGAVRGEAGMVAPVERTRPGSGIDGATAAAAAVMAGVMANREGMFFSQQMAPFFIAASCRAVSGGRAVGWRAAS
jgi:hypothetical protein